MSYKNKRRKKNTVNQLKRKIGLIKIVLLKKIKSLQKNSTMQQRQTINTMKWFRDKAKLIRSNNMKISDWVDTYIDECVLNGRPVEILTQFCLSKDLEVRYQQQGNKFSPTKAERKAFLEEIPEIIENFKKNNVSLNWYITLNRSYLDSGRISEIKIEDEYEQMINSLIKESDTPRVSLYNWEDDLFGGRPSSNKEVEEKFEIFVSKRAFKVEFKRHASWVRDEAKLNESDEQIEKELKFQIACEAEEGRFLTSGSVFDDGNFILIPFELPERYDFFTILVPDFKDRIVPILKPYPWRMDQ